MAEANLSSLAMGAEGETVGAIVGVRARTRGSDAQLVGWKDEVCGGAPVLAAAAAAAAREGRKAGFRRFSTLGQG